MFHVPMTLLKFLSIVMRQCFEYRFIAHKHPNPATKENSPNMVNSHPFPMAWISGSVTAAPTQLKMFRTKLFTATPLLGLRGMNSVSIVVTWE